MIDQHKSLSEKFLKKGFWLYFFSFIIAPTGYIVKILVSDSLSVSDVGVVYGVLAFITLISTYNDFGLTESLGYFLPKFITEKKYDKVKTILFYTLAIQTITGVLIAILLFFGADFLAENYFKNESASVVLKIFSLYFVGINFFQIAQSLFSATQNTFYQKFIDFLRLGSVTLFTIYFYFSDLGSIKNFSLARIFGLYLGIFFALIFFYKKYFKKYLKEEKIFFSKDFLKKIFKYAIFVFIGAQAGTILGQMDMQMVIYLLGTKGAGYYTNYLSIIGIPFLLIGPIFGLLFPVFSELSAKNEIEKIKLTKEIFFKIFIGIGIAFNILMFVLAKNITYTLFGEKFLMSGVILQYSVLFLIFNYLLQINFNILAGIGRIKTRVKILGIALIFNFFANLFFIQKIGVQGAALATGLGWVLIFLLSEIALGKNFRVKIDLKFLFKNIFFMGGMGGILFFYNKEIFGMFGEIFRLGNFGMIFLIGIIWFGIFSVLNFKEGKIFWGEVRKLRKK